MQGQGWASSSRKEGLPCRISLLAPRVPHREEGRVSKTRAELQSQIGLHSAFRSDIFSGEQSKVAFSGPLSFLRACFSSADQPYILSPYRKDGRGARCRYGAHGSRPCCIHRGEDHHREHRVRSIREIRQPSTRDLTLSSPFDVPATRICSRSFGCNILLEGGRPYAWEFPAMDADERVSVRQRGDE